MGQILYEGQLHSDGGLLMQASKVANAEALHNMVIT
jgi:hypothetical protein